jgi:polyisoprenoid-binding protein YceI
MSIASGNIAMPRLCRSIAAIALVGAIAGSAQAAGPEAYALDPVHTRVLFAVEHAGFSKALGTVSGSTGTLLFDRDDWRSAKLEVSVPLTHLDLGDAKWNAAALAGNLLDGERHPEARFVSSSVEPIDADHARACGELTLRGVTRPLCLEVTLNALKRHPMPPFRRTAGFSATAMLSRKEFGIDVWPNVIGDAVELRIEAEAVRSRTGNGSVAPSVDEPSIDESISEPASEPPASEPPVPKPSVDEPSPAEPVPPEPVPPEPAAPSPVLTDSPPDPKDPTP